MHCVTIHAEADNISDFHGITYEYRIILQEVTLLGVAEEIRIANNVKYNIQLCASFKLVCVCVCGKNLQLSF